MKQATKRIMEQALEQALNDDVLVDPQWDVKAVKEALVDAFLIYEKTSGRVGPAGMKSSWTPFAADLVDIWEQRRTGTNEYGREARIQVTLQKMRRAQQVIEGGEGMQPWLRGPLDSYPMLKQHLTMWIMREVHKTLGRQPITVEQMCKRRGLHLSTFNRHVKDAAFLIADRLNRAEVDLW